MSIERMVEDLRNDVESIYSKREYLSEDLFVFCPHCKKRVIDSIIAEEYCATKNNCGECQNFKQRLTTEVVKLFEELGYTKDVLQKYFKNRSNRKSMIAILNGVFANGPSVPLSFPQNCSFELTYRCNLKCKHCYIGTPQTIEDMDTESVLQVIADIAEAGFMGVPLSGGEPLLRDDLLSIAKEVKSYDMDVILSTNGTLLSQDRVREMKPYVDLACISLDSHEESVHDNFRGVDGAQKATLKGIKNCVDKGIPVSIYTTLTKFIHKKLPEFVDFVEKLEVSNICFFDLNPVGKGSTIGSEYRLSLKELQTAVETLHKLKNQSSIEILVLVPFRFIMDERVLNRITVLSGGFCNAGITTLNLTPDGYIQSCSRVRINLGNVQTEKIKDVWRDSSVLKELRDRSRLKGACGKCEYKYVCGGCRANAYGEYNDYLMEDARCI